MSGLTFEEKFVQEWESFSDFSNDKDNTDEQVIAEERESDKRFHDMMLDLYAVFPQYFSHPPKRPDRRRP